jgi:hypothetical protein
MQNILINLNIISKIKPNDKIYMNSDNFMSIEHDSAFQGIFRFIFNNSRNKNLNNLNCFYTNVYNCIDDTINSKYLFLSGKNGQLIDNLHLLDHNCFVENENFINVYNNLVELNHYLKLSITGLENLKKTYISDVVTVSKLDIIINDAETYIKKIQKKLDSINDLKKNIV